MEAVGSRMAGCDPCGQLIGRLSIIISVGLFKDLLRSLIEDARDILRGLGLEISRIDFWGGDVVLIPSRVLSIEEIFKLFSVREELRSRGYLAVGAYIWNRDDGRHVFRVFVSTAPGKITTIHIPSDSSLDVDEITKRWFEEHYLKSARSIKT